MLEVLCQRVYLATDAPVHPLYLGARLQIHHTVTEEVERLLANLLCVVPVLEHSARVQVVPYLVEVLHQLMSILCRLETLRHLGQGSCLQHVDDEYRVVSCQRTSALRDKVRVLYAVLVGSLNESIDTVVDILLDGVVHRALATWRTCAVVVNAQSAAAVHEVHVIPHLVQLYVEL